MKIPFKDKLAKKKEWKGPSTYDNEVILITPLRKPSFFKYRIFQ